MTLTKSMFKVLNALRDEAVHTQRHIATATGLSLGTVNTGTVNSFAQIQPAVSMTAP